MTSSGFKLTQSCTVGGQRNLQITIDLWLELARLEKPHLEPYPEVQLELNVKDTLGLFLIVLRNDIAAQQQRLLAFEDRGHDSGVLVPLIERVQTQIAESLILEECVGFNVVVVDADPSIGIANGDIESKVVVEGVVGVIETGDGGVGHMEIDLVGTKQKPDDKSDDGNDDDNGAEQLVETPANTSEKAAATAAAAIAATARAMISSPNFRRWN